MKKRKKTKVGEKTKEISRKDVRVFRRCELLQKVSEMKAWKQVNVIE